MWLGPVIVAQLLLLAVTVAVASAERTEGNKFEQHKNCGRFLNYKYFGTNLTEPSDYPWLVLIEYEHQFNSSDKRILCGGVLLSSRHVLTSESCFLMPNYRITGVRVGEYDLSTETDCLDDGENTTKCLPKSRSIPVNESVFDTRHAEGQPGYDVALLGLKEEVVLGDYVQPICLPDKPSLVQKYQVAGWGVTSDRPWSHPVKLRSYATIVNKERCVSSYAERNVNVKGDQICAGGAPKENACVADAGGPLMGVTVADDGSHRYAVYGIFTHYSEFCDGNGWPGIFTDVLYHRDWIVEGIEILRG